MWVNSVVFQSYLVTGEKKNTVSCLVSSQICKNIEFTYLNFFHIANESDAIEINIEPNDNLNCIYEE